MATFEFEQEDGKILEMDIEGVTDPKEALKVYEGYVAKQGFKPDQYGADWKKAKSYIEAAPEAVRKDLMDQYADYYVGQERADPGVFQEIDDYVRMFARNVPLVGEWADEANALTAAATGGDYDMAYAAEQARRRAIDKKRRPGVDTVLGRIDTGDIAKAGGVISGAVASPVTTTYRGAVALGGLLGGSDAAGRAEKDKLEAGAVGALTGAGAGAAGKLAGDTLSRVANKVKTRLPETTAGQLYNQAKNHFAKMDSSGVLINTSKKGAQGRTFTDDLMARVEGVKRSINWDDDLSPANFPGIAEVLRRAEDLATRQTVKITDLDTFRHALSGFARNRSPGAAGSRMAATRIAGQLDDLMENMGRYVEKGDYSSANAALKTGRDYWMRHKKTELIENALDRAQRRMSANYAGNEATAIKQQFRRLVEQFDNVWTDEEKKILSSVVDDDALRRAMEHFGKLSPEAGLFQLWGTGIGAITQPWVAVPAALGGYTSRRAYQKTIKEAADTAKRKIALGKGSFSTIGENVATRYSAPKTRTQKAIAAAIRSRLGRTAGKTARNQAIINARPPLPSEEE